MKIWFKIGRIWICKTKYLRKRNWNTDFNQMILSPLPPLTFGHCRQEAICISSTPQRSHTAVSAETTDSRGVCTGSTLFMPLMLPPLLRLLPVFFRSRPKSQLKKAIVAFDAKDETR